MSGKTEIHLPIIALLVGVAGIVLYSTFKNKPVKSSLAEEELDHYTNSNSFDPITVPRRDVIKHKMGWTIPNFDEIKHPTTIMDQDSITPYIPNYGQDLRHKPSLARVSNDSYSPYNDDERGDGFTAFARSYNASPGFGMPPPSIPINQYQEPMSSMSEFGPDGPRPVNSTDPVFDAAVSDTDSIPAIMVDPNSMADINIVNIQNQILKMIIANSTNVNTILSNIDTIKHSIRTYRHKLKGAYDQVQSGGITPIQLNQFLMQVISEISTHLQLPLSPQFTAQMNASPYQPVSPVI